MSVGYKVKAAEGRKEEGAERTRRKHASRVLFLSPSPAAEDSCEKMPHNTTSRPRSRSDDLSTASAAHAMKIITHKIYMLFSRQRDDLAGLLLLLLLLQDDSLDLLLVKLV